MGYSKRRFLAAALALPLLPAEAAAPMEYRYWDWGKTQKHDDYQLAALHLALDKTSAAEGPYKVVRVVANFSILRLRHEVFKGITVNLHAGPWRAQDPDNPFDRNIAVNVPIMDGLLGYRQLIIRRSDTEKFRQISSANQLKKLVAGQGRGWIDVSIYRHNGYQVDDRANLSNLLPMLLNHRFDYLPMSVVEVESVLAHYPELQKELAVAPGILIQYPLPSVFYVSASAPQLAQRLARGMVAAGKDGSLDALMLRYFRKEIETIRAANTREFVLVNPFLPAELARPAKLSRHAAPPAAVVTRR